MYIYLNHQAIFILIECVVNVTICMSLSPSPLPSFLLSFLFFSFPSRHRLCRHYYSGTSVNSHLVRAVEKTNWSTRYICIVPQHIIIFKHTCTYIV